MPEPRRLRRRVGWAAAAILADAAVLLGLLLHGLQDAQLALRAGVLWAGAVALAVLAAAVAGAGPRAGPERLGGAPPPEPERPDALEELSRLVDGCRTASADAAQFADRLRPVLVQLAAQRCGRPLTAVRLRAALGEGAAQVLLGTSAAAGPAVTATGGNGRRRVPGRGPSIAELELVVSALEAAQPW